jgi:hypothetical protein
MRIEGLIPFKGFLTSSRSNKASHAVTTVSGSAVASAQLRDHGAVSSVRISACGLAFRSDGILFYGRFRLGRHFGEYHFVSPKICQMA